VGAADELYYLDAWQIARMLPTRIQLNKPSQPQLLQIALDRKDVVYTPDWIARDMVDFFKPTGRILEPAAGDGAILKYLPGAEWCEIERGRDFFSLQQEHYDWIIGNPPYKIFNIWTRFSFTLADNVLYLFPLNKIFNDYGMMQSVREYGGVKTVRVYGRGDVALFPMGYAVGAAHYQKAYYGPMEISFYDEL
jgi:hypothetical protein